MKQFHNKNAGFTLIETMIAMFIFVLIGLAVTEFSKNIFSLGRDAQETADIQNEISDVFKIMAKEIRAAMTPNTGDGTIETAGVNQFVFFSDINNDGFREKIGYILNGTVLSKEVTPLDEINMEYNPANKTTSVIAEGITNGTPGIFLYYDSSYDGTTPEMADPQGQVNSIRLVKINLVIDKDSSKPPAAVNLTTQVSIRSKKTNL